MSCWQDFLSSLGNMKARELDRADVVASNLLFTTLALTVLLQLAGWVSKALVPTQTIFHSINLSW